MKTEAQLRPAVPADRPAIRALLAAAGLPADDLDQASVKFLVAVADGHLIGVAGAEALSPRIAMLRSFAVAPPQRGRGIGGAMLARLLGEGAKDGIEEFYLLTVTAAPYFAARGFGVMAREQAPAPVRDHPQFRGLCPASATLMHYMPGREGA